MLRAVNTWADELCLGGWEAGSLVCLLIYLSGWWNGFCSACVLMHLFFIYLFYHTISACPKCLKSWLRSICCILCYKNSKWNLMHYAVSVCRHHSACLVLPCGVCLSQKSLCLFSIFMASLYENVFTYYSPKSPEKRNVSWFLIHFCFWFW